MTTFTQATPSIGDAQSSETHWVVLGLAPDILKHNWGWFVVMGLITLLAGAFAVVLPHVAALTINLLLGTVLVVHGIVQGFHAFYMRGLKGFLWQALGAFAAIMVGGLLIGFPIAGLVPLTLAVAAFMGVTGALKLGMAFRLKPMLGWGWLALNGALIAILGGLILVQWPEISSWVLGLLVGIDLMLSGLWLTRLGLSGRRLTREG